VENLIGLGITWLIITQDTSYRLLSLAISLFLLVPITVLTASPRLSYLITRLRLFTTPDENPVSPVLSRLVAPEIITISKAKTKAMEKAL
jgi:membrane glycosyltransferase